MCTLQGKKLLGYHNEVFVCHYFPSLFYTQHAVHWNVDVKQKWHQISFSGWWQAPCSLLKCPRNGWRPTPSGGTQTCPASSRRVTITRSQTLTPLTKGTRSSVSRKRGTRLEPTGTGARNTRWVSSQFQLGLTVFTNNFMCLLRPGFLPLWMVDKLAKFTWLLLFLFFYQL